MGILDGLMGNGFWCIDYIHGKEVYNIESAIMQPFQIVMNELHLILDRLVL
jgi:hypothetical protein